MHKHTEIYYKEVVHAIIEVDRPHDLQGESASLGAQEEQMSLEKASVPI